MKKTLGVIVGSLLALLPGAALADSYYEYGYEYYDYGYSGGYYDQGPVAYGNAPVYGWGGTQDYYYDYSYPQYSYNYYYTQPQSYWCNGYYSNTPCVYQQPYYSMYNYQFYYPQQYMPQQYSPQIFQNNPMSINNINVSSGINWW